MHHACNALDTNQRFELELAIADWHAASAMKAECLTSVSRIVGCSEEDAIEICDSHENAQQVLDRLRIEVFSAGSPVESSRVQAVNHDASHSDAIKQVEADLLRIQQRVRSFSEIAYSLFEVGLALAVFALIGWCIWIWRT